MEAFNDIVVFFALTVRLQQDCAQGRRKSQGVQSRETDSHSHGETELAVEHTRSTRHERHGDKHEHHNQSDGDDGAAYLAHGVDRSLARGVIPLIEFGVDRLDHHNRVIDHNRNRQYKCREGE